YTRAQVTRFSPRSLAILEIQSRRDLEIMEKIYANSVLLGDNGPDGWGIKYAQGDFNMTSDSKLFPPRPKWEAEGYRPDEYSRWLKGDWRPIGELWAELGMDPSRPLPVEVKIEDWLFDTAASVEERTGHARFVHGHFLKPGDVQRTPWRIRCVQPPYDALPVPRAEIPPGIILSRDADAWIREELTEDIAVPLYQGLMIWNYDCSFSGWVSGTGRSANWNPIEWKRKCVIPQYLVSMSDYNGREKAIKEAKLCLRRITTAVHQRTAVASLVPNFPCGDVASVVQPAAIKDRLLLAVAMNLFPVDFVAKKSCTYLHLDWHVVESLSMPRLPEEMVEYCLRLNCVIPNFSQLRIQMHALGFTHFAKPALTLEERLRVDAIVQSIGLCTLSLSLFETECLLTDCDWPLEYISRSNTPALDPKGFWRIDKDKEPELRHTVLTLIAFHDLEEKIRACGSDREKGIEAFLNQNDGEGWMLPETLRLADYGLGHDERAKHPQPVASRFGPRFYDWQLAQSAEESWRECHLHTRNLLGEAGYRQLLEDIESPKDGQKAPQVSEPPATYNHRKGEQGKLF
ncbi:MAG: hypothetical protein V1784_12605, partial [bacterium]